MSQSPLNGDTEMTSGSELKGMLLVKPPSQHRCRKKGREEGERRKGVKVNLTCHMLRYGLVYKHLSQERKHCPSVLDSLYGFKFATGRVVVCVWVDQRVPWLHTHILS